MRCSNENSRRSVRCIFNLLASSSWAGDRTVVKQPETTTMIDIAGQQVPVVKGGLYDRYRSNPPLSVIAAEAPDVDLSWFRQLKKERVDIGFESYSPNFYYKNSRVTTIFTADLDKLKELMPAEVLAKKTARDGMTFIPALVYSFPVLKAGSRGLCFNRTKKMLTYGLLL